MTSPAAAFDPEDLAQLLDLYDAPASGDQPHRPPWTWAALNPTERAALARMIEVWVKAFNRVHAITPSEFIPPCWPHHPGLACELAVQLWLGYHTHLDPKTTPAIAGEYYLRHVPGIRNRVDRLLDISPGECRRGEHPHTWRQDNDNQLAGYPTRSTNPVDQHIHTLVSDLQFGFPHLGSTAPCPLTPRDGPVRLGPASP